MSIDHTSLRRLLRRQDGVIGLDQAVGLGLTPAMVRDRVASRAWVRVAHRTYRAADHPDTPRARTRAAVLSLGDDAVLAGATALWWWRLESTEPSVIDVAVPADRRPRARRGVRLVRSDVPRVDRVVVDGVPVVKRAVAALTAAAALPLLEGAGLLDRLMTDGAVGLDGLRAVHFDRIGRRGASRARRLLILAGDGARSEAERTAHRLLRGAGIVGWTVNRRLDLPGFGAVELDLAFEARRVAVEIDGWAYHRTLRAFLRDGPRQNAVALAGWTVIRTSWYQLTGQPEVFLATVRRAIADRPVAGSGLPSGMIATR